MKSKFVNMINYQLNLLKNRHLIIFLNYLANFYPIFINDSLITITPSNDVSYFTLLHPLN